MNATKTETEWTDEALRIAIAKACGWNFVVHPATGIGGYWEQGQQGAEGYKRGDWGSRECAVGLPDYPSDLNACHEMEKVLGGTPFDANGHSPRGRYGLQLSLVLGNDGHREIWNATARQRCLAFVKTLGLSPDGTNASGVSVPNQDDWNTISLGGWEACED